MFVHKAQTLHVAHLCSPQLTETFLRFRTHGDRRHLTTGEGHSLRDHEGKVVTISLAVC